MFVGPSGLRQDHSLRMINRMIDADLRHDPDRRRGHHQARRRASCAAASATSSRTPACSAHRTVVDNVATVPVLSGTSRREARDAGARAARAGRPRPRARRPLPRAALRRPAAARRRRPRPGRRPAGDADGRAVLGRRPGRARTACSRSSSGCSRTSARPSCSSPTTSTRRSSSATRSRSSPRAAGSPRSRRPEELLAAPADDFVASLVGRDRGFRGLSFESAADLEVEPVETEVDGLTLELDGDRRPPRLEEPRRHPARPRAPGPTSDNLRLVTDLVILSPAAAAVRVDGEGRADGLVRHGTLAEHIRRGKLSRAAEPVREDA